MCCAPFLTARTAIRSGSFTTRSRPVTTPPSSRTARRRRVRRPASARTGRRRRYAQVLARGHRVPTARRAALGEAYSWALSNSNQLHFAVAAAATAAELWQQDGDNARLIRALVTLSRQQWLTERTAAARASAERAFALARPLGDSYQNALATLNLGGLLVLNDQEEDALPHLDDALDMAERSGA